MTDAPILGSGFDHMIVSLDTDLSDARALHAGLSPLISWWKIGRYFYLQPGFPEFVRMVAGQGSSGSHCMLDFKDFDIPETVRASVLQAVDAGVSLVTVHAYQKKMIQVAVEAAAGSQTKVLCVPLLSSFDESDLLDTFNFHSTTLDYVVRNAKWGIGLGCDGVVCAPPEVAAVRAVIPADKLIVSPGIVLDLQQRRDHKRVGTPYQTIYDGADYIVVGRTIIKSSDRRAAAGKIARDISAAIADRSTSGNIDAATVAPH